MLNEIVSKNYMIAGYIVFITIPAAYIASLYFRWRNLKKDIKTIKEIQK
jgi:hypothetical protein